MTYTSIQLAESTPSLVAQSLRESLDPFFNDIHCMLRLPAPQMNLPAGCNITIALSLLTIVAGVSAAFYKEGLTDGEAFQGLLVDYYPWALERTDDLDGQVPPKDAAKALWQSFRNPLAHSLGMPFQKNPVRGRYFERKPYQIVINRNIESATEEQIGQLENIDAPRLHLHATIHLWDGLRMLSVEAFYWGVRQMIYRLTSDESLMSQVNTRLIEQFSMPKK